MEALELSPAEGKALHRGVQDFAVSQRIREDRERGLRRPGCGPRYHSQAAGTRTVEAVFARWWCLIPAWRAHAGRQRRQ